MLRSIWLHDLAFVQHLVPSEVMQHDFWVHTSSKKWFIKASEVNDAMLVPPTLAEYEILWLCCSGEIKRQNRFVLFCSQSHAGCLDSSGRYLEEQSLFCQIQQFEWNGALNLFRQNTAIIQHSVFAPTLTNHIKKSHWGGLYNLTAQILT